MTRSDEKLEDFFKAAKEAQPLPDAALMHRILQDASVVQNRLLEPAPLPATGFWAGIVDTLGGWRGVSALTVSACAGLWFGFVTPQTVSDLSAGLIPQTTFAELDYGDPYGLQEMLTEI